jgi:hypothetical protein
MFFPWNQRKNRQYITVLWLVVTLRTELLKTQAKDCCSDGSSRARANGAMPRAAKREKEGSRIRDKKFAAPEPDSNDWVLWVGASA